MTLANLSPHVFGYVSSAGETTFQATADSIIAGGKFRFSDERAVRRRVYDILNVLIAANFIEKSNGRIRIADTVIPAAPSSQAHEAQIKAVREKQKQLASKLNLFVRYQAWLRRNRDIERPMRAVQLPAIFIGYTDLSGGTANGTLDSKSVEIVSSSKPHFYSPMDILNMILITKKEEAEAAHSLGFDLDLLSSDL
jgi:hypothetical protein